MHDMMSIPRGVAIAASVTLAAASPVPAQQGPVFDVSFPASAHQGPITGRVLLFLSTDSTPEPRFQGGALGANTAHHQRALEDIKTALVDLLEARATAA